MYRQLLSAIMLISAAVLTLSLTNLSTAKASPQQTPTPRPIPVDYLQVADLPVSISLSSLEKTEKGYVLKCSADNNSSDQILGVTFLLIVIDSENKVRASANWTAGVHLEKYSGKELSLKVPLKLSIKSRDRVVLAPEQLFGRESIWRVMNARESIEAYARGDEFVTPRVQRVANQFDPPSAALRIY
jgi:hypothetical protein